MAKKKQQQKTRVTVVEETRAPRSAPRRRRKKNSGGFIATQSVKAPAAAGMVVGKANPQLRTTGRVTRVINTEIVVSLNTAVTFASAIIRLNPSSFPWLNGIAANYSKFRWRGIRFIWIPSCSTATTGNIAMALQYDEPDANPTSLSQMSSLKGFIASPFWGGGGGSKLLNDMNCREAPESVVCCVDDVKEFTNPWYRYTTSANLSALITGTSEGPSISNIYIPAILVYAVVGGPAAGVEAGQIYVQYDIDLIDPIPSALNV